MKRVVVVATAFLALAFPASGFAHATLQHTGPAFRQRVQTSPARVWLKFDQTVKALPNAIEVYSSRGDVVSRPARNEKNAQYVEAPLRRALPMDAYTVRWHVISGDGHVISGVYTFGIRIAAPPPTEAYGASGPTRTEDVVRWLYFLALALVVGGVGFRLLVARGPLPSKAEQRFYAITGIGAIATLNVGILGFVLRAEDALQLPFGRLLYGDLSPIVSGTKFGTAFIAMTLGFAVVTAFLFLAWLSDRTVFLWPAFLVGLGFVSGLSLSGHSAADAGSSWKSELADWVHLSAACLWIGGLVQLALVVLPLAPEARRRTFLRFSTFATVLVALIIAAGTYLSILRLPHVHDLWTSGYGHVLLIKLTLVAVALAWGAAHRFLVVPKIARGREGLFTRLPRSVLGESLAGMAVLLVAAVLVDSKPPASVPKSSSASETQSRVETAARAKPARPLGGAAESPPSSRAPAQTELTRNASTLATKTFVSRRTPILRTEAGP
jgi:copper transport protein